MKLLFVLFFFIGAGVAYSQDYNRFILEANRAFENKDYAASVIYFDSAFALSIEVEEDAYNAACANALAGNSNAAIVYLNRFSPDDPYEFSRMYYDKDLDAIRDENDYKKFEAKFKPDFVLFYFDILDELTKKDRAVFHRKSFDVHANFSLYSIDEIRKRAKLPSAFSASDTILNFSTKDLEFRECRFVTTNSWNVLRDLRLNALIVFNSEGNLGIDKVDCNNLMIYDNLRIGKGNHLGNFRIKNLNQHGLLKIFSRGFLFKIDSSSFRISSPVNDLNKKGLHWKIFYEQIEILHSSFTKMNPIEVLEPLDFELRCDRLIILNTWFNYASRFLGEAKDGLNIKWNKFPDYVDFCNYKLPERDVYLPFSQFDNTRFVILDFKDDGSFAFTGARDADYKDESLFDNLTTLYKSLYDNYRARADLTSANKSYVRLKEIEIAYLKQKQNRSLENDIRLKLNQMMGIYTNHATSPGKAIIITFYIIIVFAVFYFFFPSEWDKTTKTQLIADYKMFIEKNEHGYVGPFFRMFKGFILSFINALTLSMNAFVTLGFGNIPTFGIARYVCVLQGMLGWFLLSLFIVALLNQVLL